MSRGQLRWIQEKVNGSKVHPLSNASVLELLHVSLGSMCVVVAAREQWLLATAHDEILLFWISFCLAKQSGCSIEVVLVDSRR